MKTAYSYIRFSSAKQRLGNSKIRQIEKAKAYCQANDLKLDDAKVLFDPAKSGFHGKNFNEGPLRDFCDKVKAGEIPKGSVLIVENLDRFSRDDVSKALSWFLNIINSGIDIVTLMDNRRYSEASLKDSTELITSVLVFSRANEESQTKSIRTKDNWERMIKKAEENNKPFWGHCPKWLKPIWKINEADTEKRKCIGFDLVPENVAIVHRLFKECLSGKGFERLAIELNNEGLTWNRKKRFTRSTIAHILQSRAITGESKLKNGKVFPKYYPTIGISESDFFTIQKSINSRRNCCFGKRDKRITNLFGSLMVDGNNSPMLIRTHLVEQGSARSVCHRMISQAGMLTGNWTSFNYETFEKCFLQWVSEVQLEKVIHLDQEQIIQTKIQNNEATIKSIQAELENDAEPDLNLIQTIKNIGKRNIVLKKQLEDSKADKASVPTTGEVCNILEQLKVETDKEKIDDLRMKLRSNISRLVKKITVFIKSSDGGGARYLAASVELTDNSNRLFTIKAQTNQPTITKGSEPIQLDGNSYFPQSIKSLLIRNAGTPDILDNIPQYIGLKIKLHIVGQSTEPTTQPPIKRHLTAIENAARFAVEKSAKKTSKK